MATHCHTEYAVQRKAQLENSLLDLMLHQTYKEISVTDICREADIPRRTFYHYFESKDDVLDCHFYIITMLFPLHLDLL